LRQILKFQMAVFAEQHCLHASSVPPPVDPGKSNRATRRVSFPLQCGRAVV
jgi:hypothetical protein